MGNIQPKNCHQQKLTIDPKNIPNIDKNKIRTLEPNNEDLQQQPTVQPQQRQTKHYQANGGTTNKSNNETKKKQQ